MLPRALHRHFEVCSVGWLVGPLPAARGMVGIVVGIQVVGPVVVVGTVFIGIPIFPVVRPFVVITRLPIGIVVWVHLVGAVIVVSGSSRLLSSKSYCCLIAERHVNSIVGHIS